MTENLRVDLQLRGETDEATGEIGSAISGPGWSRPATVRHLGGFLRWTDDADAAELARADAGLLGRFLRLADASPAAIASFALRNGVLCAFRQPVYRGVTVTPAHRAYETVLHGTQLFERSTKSIETVHEWRQTARFFEHLLRCRVMADEGKLEDVDRLLQETGFFEGPERPISSLSIPNFDLADGIYPLQERIGQLPMFLTVGWHGNKNPVYGNGIADAVDQALEATVNSLLSLGNAAAVQVSAERGFALSYRPASLLGGLGLQLATLLAANTPVAICSECPTVYRPKRRPAVGRKNYCHKCRRKGVPGQNASAEYRRKGRKKPRT